MGFFSSNKSNDSAFPWITLDSSEQLSQILENEDASLIFKHSTRCSISSFAKRNFEKNFNVDSSIKVYLLDLLNHREISSEIAEKTGVYHQSPQAILVQNGKALYNASHESIDALEIQKIIS
jgi:bacillithiol system protein YtxJ